MENSTAKSIILFSRQRTCSSLWLRARPFLLFLILEVFGLFIINITNPTSYLSFEKLSYTDRKLPHSVQERKVMHKSIPPVPIPRQGICLRCQSCVSPGGEAFAILSHPRGWAFDICLPHLQRVAENRRKRAEKAKVFCRRKQINNWCNNLRSEHYVVLIF